MRRRVPRMAGKLGALLLSPLLSMSFSVGTASAEPPRQQGWWTSTNPGGLPLPSFSAGPDVPAKGLLVEGGSDTPTAYAALVYQLPQGATVRSLTLEVAPGTITTSGSTLRVCPLVNPTLKPAQGGPMADAPRYDCARQVTATADGSSYGFNVTSLLSGDVLAIAILPTAGTDRVVFDEPGADSLPVQGGAAVADGAPSDAYAPTGAASPAPVYGEAPGASPLGPPAVARPPTSGAPGGPALAAPTQDNAATDLPAPSVGSDGADAGVVVAVLAGLLLIAGLWLFARHAAVRAAMAVTAEIDAEWKRG